MRKIRPTIGESHISNGERPPGTRFVEDGQDGIVVGEGERDDKSEKPPKPISINGQWVLCGFDTSIGDGVHDLQGLRRPEGECRLQDNEAAEQSCAAENRCKHQETFSDRPRQVEGGCCPEKDSEALHKTTYAAQGQLLTGNLECRASRSEQNSVEITGLDLVAQQVETPAEGIGEGEGDVDETVKQGDFLKLPLTQSAESIEEDNHAKELRRRYDQMPESLHDEGSPILHLAFYADAQITSV